MITKENIEAYLLDFHEGNLSQFEIKELMDFVALHPEFKDYLDIQPLPIDFSIEFSNKESLKKTTVIKPVVFDSLHENETELFIVAKIENELNETEELNFNRALQADKNFEEQFNLYSKTIIPVDNSLIFENKDELRKVGVITPLFNFKRALSYAAAASVLLFAGYLFFRTSPKVEEEKKSAGKEKIKNEKQINPNSIEEKQESIQFANDFNSTIKSNIHSNDSLPKTNYSVVPHEAILVVQKVDSSKITSENNNQDFAFVAPMETTNPIKEPLSSKAETLTVKSFIIQRVNQVLFGKSNPNDEEKYASFSQKVSTATGILFDFRRRKSRSNKEFHLKIGKFSIDRKKVINRCNI
jgi:hypothetical protein